jgi:CubicO group peptidase (beta-lactamase class C family)
VLAPGFGAVREAFTDPGASFAAYVDGELVADLRGDGWPEGAVANVFSVGKPFAAAAALHLIREGRLGLDDRVADHWPEYAADGKAETTVRHVLAHQAGLISLREPLPTELLFDHDALAATLAAAPPNFPPGTAHGEHAAFYGTLIGELVRRVDGRTLGAYLRDEGLAPGFHFGGAGDVLDITDPDGVFGDAWLTDRSELYRQALDNPPGMLRLDVVNSREWRAAEIPAVNGHADARAIADFYRRAPILDEAIRPQATGRDVLLDMDVTWGLGFGLLDGGFGMGGIGGSLGWADPGRGVALAYVTTRMGGFDRAEALERALLSSVGR